MALAEGCVAFLSVKELVLKFHLTFVLSLGPLSSCMRPAIPTPLGASDLLTKKRNFSL